MASAVFLTPPKPLADESPSHASRAALRLCKLCAAILNPDSGGRQAFYAVRNRPPIFSAAAMATFPSLMAAVLLHVSMAARAKSRSIGADVRKAPAS